MSFHAAIQQLRRAFDEIEANRFGMRKTHGCPARSALFRLAFRSYVALRQTEATPSEVAPPNGFKRRVK
jgi:hypothetical protein